MDDQHVAQAAVSPGFWKGLGLFLGGAGGYIGKHLLDRRKAPRTQGPSTHDLLQQLVTDVAVIKSTMVTGVAMRDLIDGKFSEHLERDHSKAA